MIIGAMSGNFSVNDDILQLMRPRDATSQTDLMLKLRAMGYSVAQATLSRKLKKLCMFQISGKSSISDGTSDCGLIVLHLPPGCASGLAYCIDLKYVFSTSDRNVPILETIARDDTVLVRVRSGSDVKDVLSALRCEFHSASCTSWECQSFTDKNLIGHTLNHNRSWHCVLRELRGIRNRRRSVTMSHVCRNRVLEFLQCNQRTNRHETDAEAVPVEDPSPS
jgi:arginine repressor